MTTETVKDLDSPRTLEAMLELGLAKEELLPIEYEDVRAFLM